ncbi:MAG: hypothetical protein ACPHN2_04780 [Sinimarinibacterium flocculans]|uniref:hypothetical protein n=1 Tax=Sinimarinibacterium flocculans TaxID=985250 RepID=UPI003C59E0CD
MSTNSDLLTKYLAAEEAILDGQSYTHNGRSLTMADLRWVQAERKRLQRIVDVENGTGGGGFKAATFASTGHCS